LKSARVGVLTEFFGTTPEDADVAAVVRQAIDEMKTRGATAIDIEVPELAKLVAAANLLTQELKFYLGDYLKSAGGYAASVDDLLESGLHSSSLKGILDIANAIPNDYLSSEDYTARLAARDTLGKALTSVMDANRLDAIVYPTIRRIAPVVGGAQAGSNAALSANTGFPAISVPAGFTSGGFPVGVEIDGPSVCRADTAGPGVRLRAGHASSAPADARRRCSRQCLFRGTAESRRGRRSPRRAPDSVPPSMVGFHAAARFSFNDQTARTRLRHPGLRHCGRRWRCLSASPRESAEWRRGLRPGQVGQPAHHGCGHADHGGSRGPQGREVLRCRDQRQKPANERAGRSRVFIDARDGAASVLPVGNPAAGVGGSALHSPAS
jgi:hypothetical protein